MAQDLYPNVNSVVSNIIEQDVVRENAPVSPDAVLVIGTATKGPLYQPVRINDSNVTELFGEAPNDVYGATSLVKGYTEVTRSVGSQTDIVALRIGTATKATLNLYENQVTTSGDLAYTSDTVALTLSATSEGEEGNSTLAVVSADSEDRPTLLSITLPDGTQVPFALSVDGSVAGAYSRVSELAAAINANPNCATYIQAEGNVLEHSETITIVSGSVSGVIETEYNIESLSGSYGDKMIEITEAYLQSQYTDSDSALAGVLTATLAKTPLKDTDPNTETIDEFWRIVADEVLIGPAKAADVGETLLTLACKSDSHLDGTNITDLVVTKINSEGTETVFEVTTDYTFSTSTGIVTLVVAVALGETYTASYKYKAVYTEADVRSSITTGDPFSYFIGGDMIVFGANQPYALELIYQSRTLFQVPGDLAIEDADEGIVEFRNPDNYPEVGDLVVVTYIYEPELPAKSGASLGSGRFQASQLSGGTDGRRLTGAQYYQELAKAYIAADNLPIRFVVPQGIYLDDVLDGIDYETGLPTSRNAGYHSQLSLFLRRKSQYVSECEGFISVRPISPSANTLNPTLTEKEDWYDKLVNVSATDTTRAANVMASLDDYHVSVLVGSGVFQTQAVYGGRQYIDGFANIYAGMRYHHDNIDSMVNTRIPLGIVNDLIYPIMAMDRINSINAARYTLITRHSQDGSIIVADAPTAARASSQFNRQYNVAIVFEAVNAVRAVLDPFIGKPNKNAIRQAMEVQAKTALRDMTPDKLMNFDLVVFASEDDAISGKTRVRMLLTTANEIRKIEIETRLQLGFE